MSWLSVCTFGFLACLVVVPRGYAIWALLGLLVGLISLLAGPRCDTHDGAFKPGIWPWLATLGGVGLYGVLDAWRSGAPIGHQTVASLPWWPLVAMLWLLILSVRPVSVRWLWAGACAGALGAGGLALYEHFALGSERASGGLNAIPFGNLSLLLGVLALVGALHILVAVRHLGRYTTIIMRGGLFAAGCGVLASLLSGTRGGWIILPLVSWLLYRHMARWPSCLSLHERLRVTRRWLWLLLPCFLALLIWLIAPRVDDVIRDIWLYVDYGRTDTSIGLRIDMWHAAIELFGQRPLLGWGEGRMAPRLMAMIDSGQLDAQAQYFGFQLHNDWLDTAARRGLLGLLGLVFWYGVPLIGFMRRWRHAADHMTASLALAGLLTVVMFLGFGLTQTQLRDEHAWAAYLMLVTTLWLCSGCHHVTFKHVNNVSKTHA